MSRKDTSISNYPHFVGKAYQLGKHTVVIDDLIAEGGFSMVFLVKSNGKKYALKRMYVNNQQDLEACKLEIHIIKTLSEKNRKILRYVDSLIQRQSEEIYEILLLTKYCRSGGLIQLMNDRLTQNSRLFEPEILHIFCDLCESVADLHHASIIHRDIKIENILIDHESSSSSSSKSSSSDNVNFVLCDFGSATTRHYLPSAQQYSNASIQALADEIQKYTTLAYRSPEMVDLYSGKPITTKSDIWAMGCLLYKLCYYTTPFGESLLAIQEGRFTLPDIKHQQYSRQLNSLIGYMLDPDPIKRPDIYQVAAVAFHLYNSCNVNSGSGSGVKRSSSSSAASLSPILARMMAAHNGEAILSQLNMPLTETEWRQRQQASKQRASKEEAAAATAVAAATNTTVNPRERPKASAQINPIPLATLQTQQLQAASQAGSSAAAATARNTNKIALSIKPPVQQQQQQAFVNHHHQLSSNSSSAFSSPPQQLLPPPQQQQQQKTSQATFGFEDDFSSLSNSLSSDAVSNQQKQPQLTNPTLSLSTTTANNTTSAAEQLRKSHRRSASHSSTIFSSNIQPQSLITPQGVTNLQPGQNMQYTAAAVPPLPPHQYVLQPSSQPIATALQQQQQPAAPTIMSGITPPSLRYINHSRSASASPNVAPALLNSNNRHQAMSRTPGQKPPIASNDSQSRSANDSERTQRPTQEKINPFEDENNEDDLFGIEFDRIRHTTATITSSSSNAAAHLNMSTSSSSSNKKLNNNNNNNKKASGSSSKKSSKHHDKPSSKEDPFRNAPLDVYRKQQAAGNNNTSTSSSESSSTDTNPSSESMGSASLVITTTEGSAFQPYKKQPDPFISAPFDEPSHHHQPHHHHRHHHRHRRTSPPSTSSSSSSSSSATPTQSNEEIVRVIGNKLHLSSPSHQQMTSTESVPNPFMEAPFTAKKPTNKSAGVSGSNSASSITHQHQFAFDGATSKTPTLFDQDYFSAPPPQPQPKPQNDHIDKNDKFKYAKAKNSGGISNMSFDEY